MIKQLKWFVNFSKEAFQNESARKANFGSALFVFGGGGNDYGGFKVEPEEKKKIMPYVIAALKEGIMTVIHHGARRIVAMGVYQGQCLSGFNKTLLDHDQGPIVCDRTWPWNAYHDLHNKEVQRLVRDLGSEFPNVHIAYGDIWDGIQWMFDHYHSLGFKHSNYMRCCGVENHTVCGKPDAPFCKDPYHYIWWDDFHFTGHAYQIIASKVIPWIYRDLGCVAVDNSTSSKSDGDRLPGSIHHQLQLSFIVMIISFLFPVYVM